MGPQGILEHTLPERATEAIIPHADIEHFSAVVVHPEVCKTLIQYKKPVNDRNPEIQKIRETGLGRESGQMAQVDKKTQTMGKNFMFFFMNYLKINKIHAEGKVESLHQYAQIVVCFWSQK